MTEPKDESGASHFQEALSYSFTDTASGVLHITESAG